jgi:hypothetical protein
VQQLFAARHRQRLDDRIAALASASHGGRTRDLAPQKMPAIHPIVSLKRCLIRAMNEIGDATGDKFQELDSKLDQLSKLLQQLRAGNDSLQRARGGAAAPLDLPRLPRGFELK